MHLQSYFLCFRHRTFPIVSEFLKRINEEDDVLSVVHDYEIGLSKLLLSKGFIMYRIFGMRIYKAKDTTELSYD